MVRRRARDGPADQRAATSSTAWRSAPARSPSAARRRRARSPGGAHGPAGATGAARPDGRRDADPARAARRHVLGDGRAPRDTGEHYDLVVVGGGLSGLSAARFFQREFGRDARILILDPLDDVGGHARRNEFRAGGRTLVGYGGSQSLESPSTYSWHARGCCDDIDIEVKRFETLLRRRVQGAPRPAGAGCTSTRRPGDATTSSRIAATTAYAEILKRRADGRAGQGATSRRSTTRRRTGSRA